jgi:zinc transport system substrate-binding protein
MRQQWKITIMLAAAAVFIAIPIGCKENSDRPEKEEFLIVASFFPVYIIARNIADGAKGVKVFNMTPPVTGCLHDYSITTDDMKHLENADLFLINGAGMESFQEKISRKFPGLSIAELSEGIPLIKDSAGENPHVWVSISNAMLMAENCLKALSAKDPKNAGIYSDNAGRYIKRLDGLKKEMTISLKKYRGSKIITFHEAFPYFAKEYGFEIAAVIEREPGSGPSARELAETIEIVRKSKIKVLFAEPQYPSSSANVISNETGTKVFILDPAVTGDDDKDAYINIMKKNLSVLKKAFE